MPDVGAALERLLAGQQTVIDRLGRIEERMAQLERLWASHSIASEVVRERVTRERVIRENFY